MPKIYYQEDCNLSLLVKPLLSLDTAVRDMPMP